MPSSRRTVLCLLLIVLCVFAALGRVIRHEFVYWDDHLTLFQNPDLNPATLRGVAGYWAKEKQDLYIPLTYTVWGALAKVARTSSGLNPHIFHAANVVLHAVAGCLAFAILRLLCRSDVAACAGALLFALHPAQVEPVAWASGMKDVLCGVLSLLAVWQYLLFASSNEEPTRRRGHYKIATIAYVLAMLAKPSAVTVPLIAGCLDYFLVRRDARRLLRPLGLWVLLAFPVFMATRAAQTAYYVYDAPLWLRPVVAWDALAWYLRHLLMPIELALDYGRAPQRVLPADATTVFWWSVAVLVALICVALRRRWPWAIAAAGAFVAAVLPVLGFVRFDFQQYSTVADHYLYIAMLGPALLVAGAVATARSRGVVVGAVLVALVAMGVHTFRQARHWRDSQTLFAHVRAVNPDSFAAHGVLGFLARQAGDNVTASVHYAAAVSMYPDDPVANFNLANVLAERGDVTAALPHFARAVKAKPDDPVIRNNYAVALARVGRFEEAAAQLETVLATYPGYADAIKNLAIVRATSRPASQPAP